MVTKCVYLYQYKTGNSITKGWRLFLIIDALDAV